MTNPSTHPLVARAARGDLPPWTVASDRRRAHMARVSNLLREWAVVRGEHEADVVRWASLGFLHDLLRDERAAELRPLAGETFGHLPDAMLHGPAAAARLRDEGVADEELLMAVAYHTVGHPEFGATARALFAADFLEPGRSRDPAGRAALRARMPHDLDAVVLEIVAARLSSNVERRRPVHPETAAFWTTLVEDAS